MNFLNFLFWFQEFSRYRSVKTDSARLQADTIWTFLQLIQTWLCVRFVFLKKNFVLSLILTRWLSISISNLWMSVCFLFKILCLKIYSSFLEFDFENIIFYYKESVMIEISKHNTGQKKHRSMYKLHVNTRYVHVRHSYISCMTYYMCIFE